MNDSATTTSPGYYAALPPQVHPARAVDVLVRHPALYWGAGAVLLFVLQLASGVDAGYAVLTFLFVLAAGGAVHALGGVTTLPGLAVLLYSVQHVLVSQTAKAVLGDRADEPLFAPHATMGVYVVAMAGMWLAGLAVRRSSRLAPITPLIRPMNSLKELALLSILSITVSTLRLLYLAAFKTTSGGELQVGGIFGIFAVTEFLFPYSVAVSTAYTLTVSRGKHSLGLLNGVAMLIPALYGLFTAGRFMTLSSLVVYVFTCLAFGYRFRLKHISAFAAIGLLVQFIIVPFALHARNFLRSGTIETRITSATELLENIVADPLAYQEQEILHYERMSSEQKHFYYYGTSIPLLDRFSLIVMSDALVDVTQRKGPSGSETVLHGVSMLLPRFLNENKPAFGAANTLARKVQGLVGENDFITQPTFGFIADSFVCYGWAGAAVLPFVLMFGYCFVIMTAYGTSILRNPYALAFVISSPWNISGGTIATLLFEIFQTPIVAVVIFACLHYGVKLALKPLEARYPGGDTATGAASPGQYAVPDAR